MNDQVERETKECGSDQEIKAGSENSGGVNEEKKEGDNCGLGEEEKGGGLAGGNICYSCQGKGVRLKREKIEGRWKRVEKCCKACDGNGIIQRSRRRSLEKGWKKKAIRKSYPSFIAPGPFPLGSRDDPNLLEREDEELSFLVGNWKIFQKLSRHRYSTDDLVTTWYAHKEAQRYGHLSPSILDIGCGLGSVLLSNSWQFPDSKCLGIEAQYDRYEQAVRSIEYNIGVYGVDQERIHIIHSDMRDADPLLFTDHPLGFGLITGTPPYFAPHLPAKPGCIESTGCLFEMRGGVEVYCHVASKHLCKPSQEQEQNQQQQCPSLFVLCNTALASSRVYQSSLQEGLVILKRADIIPKENKPPLFCVFVFTSLQWILQSPHLFPMFFKDSSVEKEDKDLFMNKLRGQVDEMNWTAEMRVPCGLSVYGEEVDVICVRDKECQHTAEYHQVMEDLGKPSSRNREIFDVNQWRSEVKPN
jgi:tRNA1Val (adenine37-N6)-methyltransferase